MFMTTFRSIRTRRNVIRETLKLCKERRERRHLQNDRNIYILAGRPPSAGFCYGESHNRESAPASFDVCELVATEGSCYNDGRV